MRKYIVFALASLVVSSVASSVGCGSESSPPPPDDKPVEPTPGDGLKSGTRLKLRWYDVDGVRSVAAIFDAQRGEVCRPRLMADGQVRCLPISTAASIVYADASCTQPLAFRSLLCPPAKYIGSSRFKVGHHGDSESQASRDRVRLEDWRSDHCSLHASQKRVAGASREAQGDPRTGERTACARGEGSTARRS